MERRLDAQQILVAAALVVGWLFVTGIVGGVRYWSGLVLLEHGVKTTAHVVGKTAPRSSYNVTVRYEVRNGLYQSTSNVDGVAGSVLRENDPIGITVLPDHPGVAAIDPERVRANGLGALIFSFVGLIVPAWIAYIGLTRLRAIT